MATPEVLSALTTPFSEIGEIDFESLRTNLERLEALVDGVLAADTTGEFLTLSTSEHATLVELVLDVFGPTGSWCMSVLPAPDSPWNSFSRPDDWELYVSWPLSI